MSPDAAEVGGWRLFAGMTPEQVAVVRSACQRRLLIGGEEVLPEGEPSGALYLVRSGRVEIVKSIRPGVDRVLETFAAGDVLGAMTFLDGSRPAAGARTAEATELEVLDRAAFERVQEARPDVAGPFYRNLAAVLAGHLRATLELYRAAVQFGLEATGASALSLASLVEGLRPITLHLVGGTSLTGRLLQLDRNPAGFTLVLEGEAGRLTIVPYHAILRLEVA